MKQKKKFEPLVKEILRDLLVSETKNIFDSYQKQFTKLIEKEIIDNLRFCNETTQQYTSSGYRYGRGVISRPYYTLRWTKDVNNTEDGKNLGGFSLPEHFKSYE